MDVFEMPLEPRTAEGIKTNHGDLAWLGIVSGSKLGTARTAGHGAHIGTRTVSGGTHRSVVVPSLQWMNNFGVGQDQSRN